MGGEELLELLPLVPCHVSPQRFFDGCAVEIFPAQAVFEVHSDPSLCGLLQVVEIPLRPGITDASMGEIQAALQLHGSRCPGESGKIAALFEHLEQEVSAPLRCRSWLGGPAESEGTEAQHALRFDALVGRIPMQVVFPDALSLGQIHEVRAVEGQGELDACVLPSQVQTGDGLVVRTSPPPLTGTTWT